MKTTGLLIFASLCCGVALLSAAGCNTVCTEVGCTTGVTASVALGNVAMEDLDGTYVEACRENVCAGGFISLDDDDELFCQVEESDDFFTSCSVNAEENVVSFQVSLRTEEVEDEEHYRFFVEPPVTVGTTVEGTVAIEKTEINGSGCGYCYAGSL